MFNTHVHDKSHSLLIAPYDIWLFSEKQENSDDYQLKESHKYYDQVQGQMYMTNVMESDFVVWTKKDCAIVRIVRDPRCTICKRHSGIFSFNGHGNDL